MKFQPDTLAGVNVISRVDLGAGARIWVGAQAFKAALIVPWKGEVLDWGASGFEALTEAHFERIAQLAPEVVIFGSGARLRFARPALLRALIERGIGVETMDTGAACRTYNVLVSEGRSVLAALLLEPA
jgi:uncharacterized protein